MCILMNMKTLMTNIMTNSPLAWQFTFQNPATPIMEAVIVLHTYIMMYLILVFIIVCWFLIRSIYLFRKAGQLGAGDFNHDPLIEVVWTVAPVFILIAIAIPSFSLLYSMDEINSPFITVKVVGHQWYWSYELDVSRTDFPIFYWLERGSLRFVDKFKKFGKNFWIENLNIQKVLNVFALAEFELVKSSLYFQFFSLTFLKQIKFSLELSSFDRLWHNTLLIKEQTAPELNLRLTFNPFLNLYPNLPSFRSFIFSQMVPSCWPCDNRVFFFEFFKFMTTSQIKTFSIKNQSSFLNFDGFMVPDQELLYGGLRLLEVDNFLLLPIKSHIRFLVTSADVIHSFALPSFGVKMDGIPGRLNQVSLFIKNPGFFYGQCSELCGVNHGFMPIAIKAVDFATFKVLTRTWLLTEINDSSKLEFEIESRDD